MVRRFYKSIGIVLLVLFGPIGVGTLAAWTGIYGRPDENDIKAGYTTSVQVYIHSDYLFQWFVGAITAILTFLIIVVICLGLQRWFEYLKYGE